jgi:hypothetical protein
VKHSYKTCKFCKAALNVDHDNAACIGKLVMDVASLRRTLEEIRAHVFADLTPETSLPNNRLQIIAAKVDIALFDLDGVEK